MYKQAIAEADAGNLVRRPDLLTDEGRDVINQDLGDMPLLEE